MEIAQTFSLVPGDPRLIDHIVCELKSQGIFDQFRKECIADVDTKPAYQNLRQRVEGSVAGFLSNQKWKPELNKNQLREKLRKHILDSNFLDQGVERIVDQVVNPKIASVFLPQVEEVVYKCYGVEKPDRSQSSLSNGIPTPATSALQINTENLLPHDLESVSPDSVKSHEKTTDNIFDQLLLEEANMVEKKEETEVKVERPFPNLDTDDSDDSKDEDFESPAFEPIEDDLKRETSPNVSQMSGTSDPYSRDSNYSGYVENESPEKLSDPKSESKKIDLQSQVSDDSKNVKKMEITYDSGEDANISTPVKLNITDAKNATSFEDNSSDARQCFEMARQSKIPESMDTSENSEDGDFKAGTSHKRDDVSKTEPITHHRSSIESKTSSEGNKPNINIDASMDSNDSKSSSIYATMQNEVYVVKDTYTFANKIGSMDDRSMDDDSSSNGLKIDIQETAEYTEETIKNINRLSISGTEDLKSPNDDNKSREKSARYRDDHKRSSSSSHHHKDRKDDSRHHSKSSYSRHSSSRHDDRKHSSSHDRKDSSRSYKDHRSSERESDSKKDKHRKSSSNGESSKDSKDKHSSSHRSSSSHKHSSSKTSSSSKHSDDPHRHRHSTSDRHGSDRSDRPSLPRHDSKDSHRSERDKDSKYQSNRDSRDHKSHSSTTKHGDKSSDHDKSKNSSSSHREKDSYSGRSSHSSSEKSRKPSSSSSSDKKQDEKKSKDKSDEHCSSVKSSRTRRSTDRDSNDGNNGSMKSLGSNSSGSTASTTQTTNKDKSSSSNKDNRSNGNSSSGQSDSLSAKDKINISGGYIKSEFNMFQPIVKKPPLPLANLHRSPDAVVKKPVIHIDSQLKPEKPDEPKVEPISPVEEVQKMKKPKFASNIFEARKLMKVRKNMDIMERKRKEDAQKLLEKQNNVPSNESTVYSGNSGPELEITCMKGVTVNIQRLSFPIVGQVTSDSDSDLLYFDDESNKASHYSFLKSKQHLQKFITAINGINQKNESVIYLGSCDGDMERAFLRLSRKNKTLKTVNIDRPGIVIREDVVKVAPYKVEIPTDSEVLLPSGSKSYDPKQAMTSDILTSKQLPLKKRKITGRRLAKSIEIKPDTLVEIKPNAIQEKVMPKFEEEHYTDDSEYYSKIDDMLSRATKQDIMEIILGGEVHFDSSLIDLKRVEAIAENPAMVRFERDTIKKVETTSSCKSVENRKRKISFKEKDEIIEPIANHNNNLKEQNDATPAKRVHYMDVVSSTEADNGGVTNKRNGVVTKSILINGRGRMGLSRVTKLPGVTRSSVSPESDKSIENHHLDGGEVYRVKDFKENSEEVVGSTALARNNRQHQAAKRPRVCKNKTTPQKCNNKGKLFENNFMATGQAQ